MFGFDLMLDDLYNSWLIEINSSPAMDYSTVNFIHFIKFQIFPKFITLKK